MLIDEEFKPHLLEVNCSPSFATDTPLDYKIKKNVVADALSMLNFTAQRRQDIERDYQTKLDERQRTGKTIKL